MVQGVRSACVLGLMLCVSAPAHAQDQPPTTPPRPAEPAPGPANPPPPPLKTEAEAAESPAPAAPEWTVTLSPSGSLTFRADLKDSPGNVEIWRAAWDTRIEGPLGDRARLSVDLTNEASWYLFHNATGLVAGSSDPFESVFLARLSPRFSVQQTDHWGWYVGGIAEFAGEPGVDLGDAGTYGGYAGARYSFDDSLSISFGFGAKTRLQKSALALPLIGLDWKINERTTLSIEGLGARLSTKVRDDLTFAISGGWELREYRLDSDSPLPKGVIRDTRVPIGASLEWQPWAGATFTLLGGAVVWQEFKIDDRNGKRVSEINTDPTPFVSLSAKFVF